MTLDNLVSVFRRLARRDRGSRDSRLLSVCQFQQVLTRERARSDRSGDRFCMLSFAPRDNAAERDLLDKLPAILQRRLRATDEVGWLDAVRIGVVLPGTPPRGAWKLAEDVCHALAPLPEPLCQVYSYPPTLPISIIPFPIAATTTRAARPRPGNALRPIASPLEALARRPRRLPRPHISIAIAVCS